MPNYTRGEANRNWRGGRTVSCGYVILNREGKREHVVVAERALGRPLPAGAVVHHYDGNGLNNEGRNLVICQDQAYHMLLHKLQRVRAIGGRPFLDKRCSRCRQVKPLTAFTLSSTRGRRVPASVCKPCAAQAQLIRKAARRQAA